MKSKYFVIWSFALLTLLTACGPYHVNKDLSAEKKAEYEAQIETAEAVLLNEESTDQEKLQATMDAGVGYQLMGNYKKALSYYEDALAIDVTNFVALNNSADIYEEAGDYDRAAKFIYVLFTNNQDSQAVLKDLVRIYCKADMSQEALALLESYATKHNTPENTKFISDTYIEIGACSGDPLKEEQAQTAQ